MPLTLEQFLSIEPALVAVRQDVNSAIARGHAGQRELRRLQGDERSLVELLARRWESGVAGWLTRDEADQVARDLTALAADRGVSATVTVEDLRLSGDRIAPFLVFDGGPHGQHHMPLTATSPVRLASTGSATSRRSRCRPCRSPRLPSRRSSSICWASSVCGTGGPATARAFSGSRCRGRRVGRAETQRPPPANWGGHPRAAPPEEAASAADKENAAADNVLQISS